MVISFPEYQKLLSAWQKGLKEFDASLNLGKEKLKVRIEGNCAFLPSGERIPLGKKIKENFLYLIKDGELVPLAIFSEETNLYYKLIPTDDWPALSISAVPMHKICLSSPKRDAENKVRLLRPYGIILDTCMGLGYTAILSARRAEKVYTFEEDENVIRLAEVNPFSEELFKSDKIILRRGDVFYGIDEFNDNFFNCILHDPPTFKFSPQLYSQEFYLKLRRVLRRGGRLFHYTPSPAKKRGRRFPQEVRAKLREVGFKVLKHDEEAGGLLCINP